MGNKCFKATDPIVKKSPPMDISIPKNKGSHEGIFESLENINIFKYYNVQDIMYLFINNFPRQGEGVTEAHYYIFIEKKFIRNQQISDWILNEERLQSEIKDFHSKLFDIFHKGFKSYYKAHKGEKYREDNLPTVCFMPFATLYGNGRNDTKAELIFNLLCNQDQVLEDSDEFRYFVFSSMCLPAGITLFVMKVLSDENEEYKKKMDKFDFTTIFDTYQIKDAINATEEFFKEIFTPEKPSLTYKEFLNLLGSSEALQSLFNQGNTRKFLEKHNI